MSFRLSRALAISCAAVVVAACVPRVRFDTTTLAPAGSRHGAVAVGSVVSKRAGDRGGLTFEVLGRVRGGYGNPFSLRAEQGRELDVVLREAMSDALRHTGLDADSNAKPSTRLDLEVQDFWCDGYMGYQVTTTVLATLVDTRTDKPVAQKTINLKDGFAIVLPYSPMHASFSRVVDGIKRELVAFLETDAAAKVSQR